MIGSHWPAAGRKLASAAPPIQGNNQLMQTFGEKVMRERTMLGRDARIRKVQGGGNTL